MFPCAICFKSIPSQTWGVTECGHVFHEACCLEALAAVPNNNRASAPGVGPCPNCRVVTRFIRVYCPEVKNILDQVSRLRVAHLVQEISGISIQEQNQTRNNAESVALTISSLPKSILCRVFQYCINDAPGMRIIASHITMKRISTTCKLFNDVIGDSSLNAGEECSGYQYKTSLRDRLLIPRAIKNIEKWQNNDINILLQVFGGAVGIRNILPKIIDDMDEAVQVVNKISLRGDTIYCLTEIVQSHIIMRLERSMQAAIQRSKPANAHEYPEVIPDDFNFVDIMMNTDRGLLGTTVQEEHESNFLDHWRNLEVSEFIEHIGQETSWDLARIMAFRAGIVKLSREASSLISAEIMHCMTQLLARAIETIIHRNDEIGKEWYIPRGTLEQDTKYFNDCSPPCHINEEGKLELVVVPGQIMFISKMLGLQPLVGFGEFGTEWWAPVSEESVAREVQDARDKYFEPMDDDGSDFNEDDDEDDSCDSDSD